MEVTIWRYRTSGKKIYLEVLYLRKKNYLEVPQNRCLLIFWEFIVKIVTKGMGKKNWKQAGAELGQAHGLA